MVRRGVGESGVSASCGDQGGSSVVGVGCGWNRRAQGGRVDQSVRGIVECRVGVGIRVCVEYGRVWVGS